MKYPTVVGYAPHEVSRDEYRPQEAPSPKEAARRALQCQFERGEKYEPGEYIVTVLSDDEPKTFRVLAERAVETYVR